MTRITRSLEIDMGHRVTNHDGKCKSLHGHRYKIVVDIRGSLHTGGSQEGMVLDYGVVKRVMMEKIDAIFDHGTTLWSEDPLVGHELGPIYDGLRAKAAKWGYVANDTGWKWGKLVLMHKVPTAENLAELWFRILQDDLERFLHDFDSRLYSVTVWETPNCSATYKYVDPDEFSRRSSGKRLVPDNTNDVGSRGMSDHA